MKPCIKCTVVKPLVEFYKGTNKCKPCTRFDVTANRKRNIEHYRKYDRERGNRQNPSYLKSYRESGPNKYKAVTMVNNAVRDGKLFREPCEACCSEVSVHAHHDDYLKPLNVRWLCAPCHKQWHIVNGEGLNARSPIK